MENTTAGKKRKLCHEEEEKEEGDDNDEEKMEKFFTLVKSIREARARLMTHSSCAGPKDLENNRMMKRKVEEEKPVEVWKPTFQREDFLEEGQMIIKNPHVTPPGSSQSKEGTEKEDLNEGLDLRLSL